MSGSRDWREYPMPAWALIVFLIVFVSGVSWLAV